MNKALLWSVSICTLAGGLALAVPGTASAAPGPGVMALAPAFGGRLYGVSTPASNDVWAVGLNDSGTLIVHWNGSGWSQSEVGGGYLLGVAGSGVKDQWAVGGTNWFSPSQTLAEHWNGSSWRRVGTPNPAGGGYFNSVAATSASNAWAVGLAGPGPGVPGSTTPLIEHWNGRHWTIQRFQEPAGGGQFGGVTALSPSNAWAVGWTDAAVQTTLIEHWNGRHWSVVPTQSPGDDDQLESVTAAWTNNIWAVGYRNPSRCGGGLQCKTLVEHWNGSHWTLLASPNPPAGYLNILLGVRAASRTSIYAVGSTDFGSTLIMHWNGKAWS